MKNLTFDNGIEEYDLDGKVTVKFNPTDVAFLEKLSDSFQVLDLIQEEVKLSQEEITDEKDVFNLAKNLDTKMRDIINALFGQDVCTPLFGEMNLFASAGGLPVWANLMLAIADEVQNSMQGELKKREARIRKYTDKYKK
ncbi:MAG: hypothetical protein IKS55_15390 [Oscillospiraceae bacterium]|nr:hypothetical protein [Oscillospiraceae bacterium]